MSEQHFSDIETVNDTSQRDSQSAGGLETVYHACRHQLLRFLIARTGDQDEALDVLQETWIRLQTTPTGPIANPRAYLFRMCQNLVVDRARAKQRRMQRDRIWSDDRTLHYPGTQEAIDVEQKNAEDDLLEREEIERLVSALKTLPDGARRVFEMHKIEGLSHLEIAARLHISKSGVEKHMAVAMKHLRRALID
ncbi:putative RNA polymerase ECF-type sigma factor [Caenibius tardaugens NBRC 16725]|uniref:Putative RNA polymerase ECF-type sigma factor n=1 Tax=Caenibius tardaugens NBRC 16725 TaxID=1219035 RepID=U2YL20_9SPHN|nr:sigma-70 family RNA polymerase sigma factor [Caenibius tardaugens]GAD49285.1 putative RNA polymerase ECF-type sigma factor [Caenibius tardaugens NBRC 16725]